MTTAVIYGITLRYVKPKDIIEPNDHNTKLDALWRIYYELSSLNTRIKSLEAKVGT